MRNPASNHRNSSTTHHAWALDEPCRTDADMAAVALPSTLRQATIRDRRKKGDDEGIYHCIQLVAV